MKPQTVILSLTIATLLGVTVVTTLSESEAQASADQAKKEAIDQIREAGIKVATAERRAFDAEAKAKAATSKLDSYMQSVENLKEANETIAKANTKVAELEKAREDAALRMNELSAEIARLRDGSEVKDLAEKNKKLELDLESCEANLREAQKARESLQEELIRVRSRSINSDSTSTPDFRPFN